MTNIVIKYRQKIDGQGKRLTNRRTVKGIDRQTDRRSVKDIVGQKTDIGAERQTE